MSVYCECCVLSGRGLCDELITRPGESYRMRCVVVCDQETSRIRRPWSALVRRTTKKKRNVLCITWPIKLYVQCDLTSCNSPPATIQQTCIQICTRLTNSDWIFRFKGRSQFYWSTSNGRQFKPACRLTYWKPVSRFSGWWEHDLHNNGIYFQSGWIFKCAYQWHSGTESTVKSNSGNW
jgi:hypothetical protein